MKIFKALFLSLLLSTTAFAQYHQGDKVVLVVTAGCPACAHAEAVLDAHHIPYVTRTESWGIFPQLYVNNKYKGHYVESWINSND